MADQPEGDPGHAADGRIAAAVAAASAALGRPLTDPVSFGGGSTRSLVLRCRDTAAGTDSGTPTVVVKTYPLGAEGVAAFAAEAAGLALASGSGLTPVFLAAHEAGQAIVMSDLGDGGSMADVLLADSPDRARTALLDWADACGRLSISASGREAEFGELEDRYRRAGPSESYAAGLPDRIRQAGAHAMRQLGVTLPDGLVAELGEIAALVGSQRYAVFSPGDICPDNNLVTADGIRFLDFEAAGYHCVFLDAAYIRMPFSTCWCVFRLPAGLSAAIEARYRGRVCEIWPALADDAVWQPGIRRAVAAWTLSSMSWLLRRSVEADVPMDPEAVSPRTRQLIRHRWQVLATELESAAELPAVATLMRTLLAATTGWQAPELPLYPALR